MDSKAHSVELDKLVGLFFNDLKAIGKFSLVDADDIPEPQKSLLNHDFHMTVTVEKFHSSPVDVVVQQEKLENASYCREICLQRQSDGQTVQYGIVRLNFDHLDEDVRLEILEQSKPLGRVLIERDVLRRVKLLGLYEIEASEYLQSKLPCKTGKLYGRTAIIYCNDEPAIELLEIVSD